MDILWKILILALIVSLCIETVLCVGVCILFGVSSMSPIGVMTMAIGLFAGVLWAVILLFP